MLKAGFARLDVTPPLGTFVPGAGILRLSEKVLDPIFLNALAVSLDGEILEGKHFEVNVIPSAIKFVLPEGCTLDVAKAQKECAKV